MRPARITALNLASESQPGIAVNVVAAEEHGALPSRLLVRGHPQQTGLADQAAALTLSQTRLEPVSIHP